jgi:hypothetical protein
MSMWRCPVAVFRWRRRLNNRHSQRTFSKVGAMIVVVVVEKGRGGASCCS